MIAEFHDTFNFFLPPHFFHHFCLMNVCIASATALEQEWLKGLQGKVDVELQFLVHGVGILESVFSLQHYLQHHSCDLLIQCGVAGSYHSDHKPGDVVVVKKDEFECGAEEKDASLLRLSDLQLGENLQLINPNTFPLEIPEVQALTVSVCSGTADRIRHRNQTYHADIESMEGAACHYVALKSGTPFYQIRGISNKVEPRNRDSWQMKEAIHAYSEMITQFIKTL